MKWNTASSIFHLFLKKLLFNLSCYVIIMGIEKFFSSIENNSITNSGGEFTYKLKNKIITKYLLIDFNSIIHVTSFKVVHDLNYVLYHTIREDRPIPTNNKAIKILKEYNLKDLDNINLDNIIINKVEEYLLNILTNFIDPNKLTHLYIAIDGVPNKTKMLQQKRRRYMGIIIEKLKTQIRTNFKDILVADKVRFQYEKNKLTWPKINISPGTIFMNNLTTHLQNLNIKSICKNIKEYICSGPDIFGEGEKKIIDYCNINKQSIIDNITIYSPDSDMTLLCLLLSNRISDITILRNNPQDNNYDVINITMLRKNLCDYVKSKMPSDFVPEYNNIINDIVFVLTAFGNDFLPKIESINVKYDFNKIIDKYIKYLSQFRDYIITFNTKYMLNQTNFINMLQILKDNEAKNLQNIYITNHYHNYNKLKKILGADNDNFITVINLFLDKLRKFNKNIRNNTVDNDFWLKDEAVFIETLKKLTKLDHFEDDNNKFINAYKSYYKTYNKLPLVKVSLQKYSNSINDQHYRDKLDKSLDYLDDKLKITKYDEEIFKLDNMLDEYSQKLNAKSLNLGYVSVDLKTYMWKAEPIQSSVEKYYKNVFHINMNQVDTVTKEYIDGLVWVTDYYYNENDESNNEANIWFYKYNNSPLLTQIYDFMIKQKDNYLETVEKNLDKYKIPIKDFFTPEAHLIYTSPINLYEDSIPKKYKKVIKKIDFIDIDKIVAQVMDNNNTTIDCRGIMFLNNCHILNLYNDDINKSWAEDKKFIEMVNSSSTITPQQSVE